MKNTKDIKIKDPELLNNPLYNTSAVNLIIHKIIEMTIKMIILLERMIVLDITKTTTIETMIDIEVTVETIHKIITDQILDKDIL